MNNVEDEWEPNDYLWDMVKGYADRRDELAKKMNLFKLTCPECSTRQIQLVGYMDIKRKCRSCKHKFEWEV